MKQLSELIEPVTDALADVEFLKECRGWCAANILSCKAPDANKALGRLSSFVATLLQSCADPSHEAVVPRNVRRNKRKSSSSGAFPRNKMLAPSPTTETAVEFSTLQVEAKE